MAAAAQAGNERAALDKLWRQRVERARYAADRARRQYQLADPENRLVTRQLEAGWEEALAEAGRLQGEYQRFAGQQPAVLADAERDAIRSWPPTSRQCGPRRRPPRPTARNCCGS